MELFTEINHYSEVSTFHNYLTEFGLHEIHYFHAFFFYISLGHILQAVTMVLAVPIIQLQLYVNPILHYLVPPAIICLIVHRQAVDRGKCCIHAHRFQ